MGGTTRQGKQLVRVAGSPLPRRVLLSVWLLLVERIGMLREPAALPGWLATTTQRECLRVLRTSRRHDHAELPDEQLSLDHDTEMIEEELLSAERDVAVRAAFAELP